MRCSTSSTLSSLWLSTCSEVGIFIDVPQGVRAKQLEVSIQAGHLRVGIQGLPPYLDKGLGGRVRPSESLWTLEDGVLHLQLAKAEEGATWASAIAGAPPPSFPCSSPCPGQPHARMLLVAAALHRSLPERAHS
jgi:hypothetical protein